MDARAIDMINSRSIDDLDPEARAVCQRHIIECRSHGVELLITSTWRDIEQQDALYSIGRTVRPDRRMVTNARGGHSWHNYKCAWDVVPLIEGKPIWDATDPIWKTVIACGKMAGAEAGAEWKSFPDLCHFQFVPGHISLDEALARFTANGTIFAA